MKTKYKVGLGIVLAAAIVAVTGWYLHDKTVSVLQPAGHIGHEELDLIIFCSLISVTVVVPVFFLLFTFAWKYREGNTRAKYSPDLDGDAKAEFIWWMIPTVLLLVISLVNWHSTYALDPFKHLQSDKPTMHVQVVALDWKWLFIYPEQHVASVNIAYVPAGTPVDFEITSDTVMTSFWAPQLGGQMYAMPGMTTHLNLVADKVGKYNGVAANISGKGFADQKFVIAAVQPQLFSQSVASMRASSDKLDSSSYALLARPGVLNTVKYYGSVDSNLYDTITMKYMMPMGGNTNVQVGA